MKQLITFLFIISSWQASGQCVGCLPMGTTNTTVWTRGPHRIDGIVRLSELSVGMSPGDTALLYITNDSIVRKINKSQIAVTYYAGYGINLLDNVFSVDSTKFATQYDLTQVSVDSGIYVTITKLNNLRDSILALIPDTTYLSQSVSAIKDSIDAHRAEITAHATNVSNPHSVTFDQTLTLDSGTDKTVKVGRLLIGEPKQPSTDTIVFIGTSITSGFGLNAGERYASRICAYYGAYEDNRAIAGSVMMNQHPVNPYGPGPNLLSDLSRIPVKTPGKKFLVIEYGYNDMRYNGANYTELNFGRSLDTALNFAIAQGWMADVDTPNILLKGIVYMPPTAYASEGGNPAATLARHTAFIDTIKAKRTQYGVLVSDPYYFLNARGGTIGGRKFMMPDSVHINASGHKYMAQLDMAIMRYPISDNGEKVVVEGVIEAHGVDIHIPDTLGATESYYPVVQGANGKLKTAVGVFIQNSNTNGGGSQSADFDLAGNGILDTITVRGQIFTGGLSIGGNYRGATRWPGNGSGWYGGRIVLQPEPTQGTYAGFDFGPFGGRFMFNNGLLDNGIDVIQSGGSISGRGIGLTYSSTTAAANIALNNNSTVLFADATSNNVTVELPVSGISAGRTFIIKKLAGANSVILDPTGSVTIDGLATFTITTGAWVRFDGSVYDVLIAY